MPKSNTAPMPAVAISVASATSSEMEKRSMPGIEGICSRTFSPATTKRGWIRCEGDRFVSRTRPRKDSVRRRRRMRVAGNGTGGEFRGGTQCPSARRPVAFPTVEARGLVKRYGQREALRGVDLHTAAGELVAVIGPNGAGKTTLLSILAGISRADEGEVHVPQEGVGWVPQQAALYR